MKEEINDVVHVFNPFKNSFEEKFPHPSSLNFDAKPIYQNRKVHIYGEWQEMPQPSFTYFDTLKFAKFKEQKLSRFY